MIWSKVIYLVSTSDISEIRYPTFAILLTINLGSSSNRICTHKKSRITKISIVKNYYLDPKRKMSCIFYDLYLEWHIFHNKNHILLQMYFPKYSLKSVFQLLVARLRDPMYKIFINRSIVVFPTYLPFICPDH